MKRRIFSILLCCIMVFSLGTQDVLAEGQNSGTCDHDFTAEVVSSDTLKKEATCAYRAEYYYSCSICGVVENNDDHIFYGGWDSNNHKGPSEWIITDTGHKKIWKCCRQAGSYEEHQMNEGVCTICGYNSQCVHANENHDEKCDYCGVLYLTAPIYLDEYRSTDVIPIRYTFFGAEQEGDWVECFIVDRKGTIIAEETGDALEVGYNFLIPENLEDDAYTIRASLMRNDEAEGEKEICRSEIWVVINTDSYLVEFDKTVEYSSGLVYDISELFVNLRSFFLGGLEQYSIVGGTGEGTLNVTELTVSKPGTFIVQAFIPAQPYQQEVKTTATLTVTCGHNLEKIPAEDATASETGNEEYWHCLYCDKYFADENCENEIELADTVTQKLPPEITEGKGQSITSGDKKELTFRSNAAFGDFVEVRLDGSTLNEDYYTKAEGSIIITLDAEYVSTL